MYNSKIKIIMSTIFFCYFKIMNCGLHNKCTTEAKKPKFSQKPNILLKNSDKSITVTVFNGIVQDS